jgi:uncharacterized damage-inducible protein DinB
MKHLLLGSICLTLLSPLFAAEQANPWFDDYQRHWKMSKQFTVAGAEAMPAEHYGFKPNPEEMSFGGLMLHIAMTNAFRFAQVAGVADPLPEPKSVDKDTALRLLNQSFDFCASVLEKLTPEQLTKMQKVDWYELPEVTGRELLTGMFTHTAHHRGQAEVYMRIKGIKPPAYRY